MGYITFTAGKEVLQSFVTPIAQLTGTPWTERGEDLYEAFVKQAPTSQPSPLPDNVDKRSSPADSALGRDVLQTASSPVGKYCSCFKKAQAPVVV